MAAETNPAYNTIKLRLDDVVRSLKANYEIWKSCHSSGLPLVTNLVLTFGRCLSSVKKMETLKTSSAINAARSRLQRKRNSLATPYKRLLLLLDRLLDASEHTRENLKTLRQLLASDGEVQEHIFYRSWELRDIVEFAESVMSLYDAEYEIKEMVVEELINCTNHGELTFLRQAWRDPRHALTAEFTAMFKEFEFETHEV